MRGGEKGTRAKESGGGDIGVATPMAEGVEGKGDSVAKVEGFDGSVKQIGNGAIKRGARDEARVSGKDEE